MVPAGNKAKRLSWVNHTTKAIHHHLHQKIQNFEKMKKTSGDIIILHKCTKNHDHMLYCS